MESTIKILAILFVINSNCKAQQMIQTHDDIYKLKANEQQFINKPLKNVLKEIKPEIKMAFAIVDYPSFFAFKFFTATEINRRVIGRKHNSIYIYVEEPIDWNFDTRIKGKEYQWTKEDLEKYGNLTITRIKVVQRIED
ncbi:hypothetical protein D0817_15545 [Flavobacterium cupreum]|uniref:Uncharacterized protein n=1 Tax=Flavobacterium cupreum TaxID=2133766 RepID=A0A434A5H9_9FLAO|nr:hypothetical protein [Flavobacterium cupreum]RUT69585.1 hypothetical protein D0817_15545 [Flavobacterium cupreum]